MQKMIDYISEEDTCRSSYLLEYFGQKESADCGTCDVCRSSRKAAPEKSAAPSVDSAAEIRRFINEEMAGKYTLDDISRRFAGPASRISVPESSLPSLLRRLIDLGSIPPPQL